MQVCAHAWVCNSPPSQQLRSSLCAELPAPTSARPRRRQWAATPGSHDSRVLESALQKHPFAKS